MKKRKPNTLSRYFRRAAELKVKNPGCPCCACLVYAEGPTLVYLEARSLFRDVFHPGGEDPDSYWWTPLPWLGTEDPDFEARMLALLLAELIAMEGGL